MTVCQCAATAACTSPLSLRRCLCQYAALTHQTGARGMIRSAILRRLVWFLAVFCLAMAPRSSVSAAPALLGFDAWVRALWPEAEASGVSRATFDKIFAGMKPNCELPGVFCSGETAGPAGRKLSERTGLPATCNKVTQTEFLQPEKYFPPKYLRHLALRGREILDKLEKEGPKTHEHVLDDRAEFPHSAADAHGPVGAGDGLRRRQAGSQRFAGARLQRLCGL